MRYPDRGRRGSAFGSRAAGYGAFGGAPHTQRSNDGIALIVMLEIPRAVTAAGKCAGTLALTPQEAAKVAGWGATYLLQVTTSLITKALKDAAATGAGEAAQLEY